MLRKMIAAMILVGLSPVSAIAATDLGEGRCQQEDGQLGVWNGTSGDDAGCVTEDEYRAMYSLDNLVAVGEIEGYTDNGDGTAEIDHGAGITNVTKLKPLDRSTALDPESEPNAPTVREVLFPTRHITGGGVQEV